MKTDSQVERIYWERYKDLNVLQTWNFALQDDLCRDSISYQTQNEIEGKTYTFTSLQTFNRFWEVLARIDPSRRFLIEGDWLDLLEIVPDGLGGLIATTENDLASISFEYDVDDCLRLDYLDERSHCNWTILEASRSGSEINAIKALLGPNSLTRRDETCLM